MSAERSPDRTPTEPWFVANATRETWKATPDWGRFVEFSDEPFRDFNINIQVIGPGERSTMYHGEGGQEGFLVLSGSCTAIVEDEERTLTAWDYLHCPAWTRHTFANTGEETCAIVMIGARRDGEEVACEYPVSDKAVALGAGVAEATEDARVAYKDTPEGTAEAYREGTLPGA